MNKQTKSFQRHLNSQRSSGRRGEGWGTHKGKKSEKARKKAGRICPTITLLSLLSLTPSEVLEQAVTARRHLGSISKTIAPLSASQRTAIFSLC